MTNHAAQLDEARQASLSITNSRSSLRLRSIESVMPSSHLILCHPLLLLTPIPPSIRFFSNESTLRKRWPKNWSFSFTIIPSKEIPGLISFRMDCLRNSNFTYVKLNYQKYLVEVFENLAEIEMAAHRRWVRICGPRPPILPACFKKKKI